MAVSIYLSNEDVSVVTGRLAGRHLVVSGVSSIPMPDETYINGMVLNEKAVADLLAGMRRDHRLPRKNVRLVLDGNAVKTRVETVPPLPHKATLSFVRDLFYDATARDEADPFVYDYAVLERGRQNRILCAAMEQVQIKTLMAVFRRAGIGLHTMDIALNCAVKLMGILPDLNQKTFILGVVDSGFLVLYLFSEGKFSLSNRKRILSDRGSESWHTDILGAVSSMLQFNSSQKNHPLPSQVLLSGLRPDEAALTAQISSGLGVSCTPLQFDPAVIRSKSGPVDSRYLYALGSLIGR